jgi:SAM-dependent methyltransferase
MSCPICQSEDVAARFNINGPLKVDGGEYQILRCRRCGFNFARGAIGHEIIKGLYDRAFHASSQQNAAVGLNGLLSSESSRFPVVVNAYQRAAWLSKMGLGGRLLDVGAGRGFFVKASAPFFDAEGIDLSDAAEEFGRELRVPLISGDFMSHDFEETKYDVITLWDVLAGLPHPSEAMKKIKTMLNPGGTVILTLPRVTGLVPRLMGRYWPLFVPPVNLGYYSETSIELLLTKNGFIFERSEYLGKYVAVSFLVSKLGRALNIPWLVKASERIPRHWRWRINLRDIVTVVATPSVGQAAVRLE